MNDLFKTLADQLKGAGGGSKIVAALVGVAVLGAIGVTGWVANKPHMEILRSNLQGHELSAVGMALGNAEINFTTSGDPGPFTVFVDADDKYRAFQEIYKAGALDKPLPGITTAEGIGSVFQDATSRNLVSMKKRWQEMELTLSTLDFIHSAKVSTSIHTGSVLGRKGNPQTASVTLKTYGRHISEEQCDAVSRIVSLGLGIKPENIVVTDEKGSLLVDGMAKEERALGGSLRDLAEFEVDWERTKTEEINARLTQLHGPNMAVVSLDAIWDIDQSLTRSNTTKKGAMLSKTESKTETPVGTGNVGGPAGFHSNMPADGSGTDTDTPAPEPKVATSEEKDEKYAPTHQSSEKITNKYVLSRLSIGLWVDESMSASAESVRSFVANALGHDETRDGPFVAQVGPIYTPEEVEGEEVMEEPAGGIGVLLEKYMKRGVEIAVALVFLFLLLKSLKGARGSAKTGAEGTTASTAGSDADIDPELLARAQVEELLQADPDRVGEILSSWAREEAGTAGVNS